MRAAYAAADGFYSFRARVSVAREGGRAAGSLGMLLCFPADNGAPSTVPRPQGCGQAFLDASLQKGILVLCNIFRGFALHVQPKVTQSERGKFLSVPFFPMPAPLALLGQLRAGRERSWARLAPRTPTVKINLLPPLPPHPPRISWKSTRGVGRGKRSGAGDTGLGCGTGRGH